VIDAKALERNLIWTEMRMDSLASSDRLDAPAALDGLRPRQRRRVHRAPVERRPAVVCLSRLHGVSELGRSPGRVRADADALGPGEADGYAWQMTGDPFPNTPSHHVLMSHAFGDHQVSNWAAAVEARAARACARRRSTRSATRPRATGTSGRSGRSSLIRTTARRSRCGTRARSSDNCSAETAALLLVNPPAFGDCPAGQPQNEWGGHDPHEASVTDQCGGQPCHSRGWMGAQ
jgi:hypothetical protein